MPVPVDDPSVGTRSTFGGTEDDYVSTIVNLGGHKLVAVAAGVNVTFWDSQTGGTQYGDLVDDTDSPTTSVTSDENGYLPEFTGPADTLTLWADAGGPRARVTAHDVIGILGALESSMDSAAAAAASAAAVAAIPTTTDTLIAGRVAAPGSASQAAVDARIAAIGPGGGATPEALAALSAQQGQLMGVAATREELVVAWSPTAYGASVEVATSTDVTIFIPQFPVRILSASMVREFVAPPGDAGNYLTLGLRKRSSTGAVLGDMVTKTSAQEGLASRVPWTFDGSIWNETYRTLDVGDYLQFLWRCTGTATMRFPFCLTVRYEPL